MKSKKLLLLAALLGIATTLLIYYYMDNMNSPAGGASMGKVLVARRDIPAGTLITSEMIEEAHVPQAYIHPQAVTKKAQVTGTIAASSLVKGEQLLQSKVVKDSDTRAELAYRVPVGKRAVTVPVDEISGISGLIRVGDHVDVVGTASISAPSSGSGAPEAQRIYSVIALQNIEVLAIGQEMSSIGSSGTKSSANKQTATLAVGMDQALPLVMASERGTIRFLLRSPADQNIVPTAPFELRDLLKAGTRNAPSGPPAGAQAPEAKSAEAQSAGAQPTAKGDLQTVPAKTGKSALEQKVR